MYLFAQVGQGILHTQICLGVTMKHDFLSFDAYLRVGTPGDTGTDTPPYGMGGWLMIIGFMKHYFA